MCTISLKQVFSFLNAELQQNEKMAGHIYSMQNGLYIAETLELHQGWDRKGTIDPSFDHAKASFISNQQLHSNNYSVFEVNRHATAKHVFQPTNSNDKQYKYLSEDACFVFVVYKENTKLSLDDIKLNKAHQDTYPLSNEKMVFKHRFEDIYNREESFSSVYDTNNSKMNNLISNEMDKPNYIDLKGDQVTAFKISSRHKSQEPRPNGQSPLHVSYEKYTMLVCIPEEKLKSHLKNGLLKSAPVSHTSKASESWGKNSIW